MASFLPCFYYYSRGKHVPSAFIYWNICQFLFILIIGVGVATKAHKVFLVEHFGFVVGALKLGGAALWGYGGLALGSLLSQAAGLYHLHSSAAEVDIQRDADRPLILYNSALAARLALASDVGSADNQIGVGADNASNNSEDASKLVERYRRSKKRWSQSVRRVLAALRTDDLRYRDVRSYSALLFHVVCRLYLHSVHVEEEGCGVGAVAVGDRSPLLGGSSSSSRYTTPQKPPAAGYGEGGRRLKRFLVSSDAADRSVSAGGVAEAAQLLHQCFLFSADAVQGYLPQLLIMLCYGPEASSSSFSRRLQHVLVERCSVDSLQFAHALHWFLTAFLSDGSAQGAAKGGGHGVVAELQRECAVRGEQAAQRVRLVREYQTDLEGEGHNNCTDSSSSRPESPNACAVGDRPGYPLEFARTPLAQSPALSSMSSMGLGGEHQTHFVHTLAFWDRLCALSLELIQFPRELRTPMLRRRLREEQLLDDYLPSATVYAPVSASANPHHRLYNVHVDECFAFSTKERAPVFLCLEVVDYRPPCLVDNALAVGDSHAGSGSKSNTNTNADGGISVERLRSSSTGGVLQSPLDKLQSAWKSLASPAAGPGRGLAVELGVIEEAPDLELGGESPSHTGTDVGRHCQFAPSPERSRAQTAGADLRASPFAGFPTTPPAAVLAPPAGLGQWASPPPTPCASMHVTANPSRVVSTAPSPARSISGSPADRGELDTVRIAGVGVAGVADDSETGGGAGPTRTRSFFNDKTYADYLEHHQTTKVAVAGEARDVSSSEGDRLPLSSGEGVDVDDAGDSEGGAGPSVVFSECWSVKEERIRRELAHLHACASSGVRPSEGVDCTAHYRPSLPLVTHLPGWRLLPVIVKANDDLRQEQLAGQLLSQIQTILVEGGVRHWMRTYGIVATGADCGVIECVPDTISLDALHGRDPQYTTLLDFYQRFFGFGLGLGSGKGQNGVPSWGSYQGGGSQTASPSYECALDNFTVSLATYSMVCHVLAIKDRHNGNILLDRHGHLLHIDFGFMLGNTPGGNIGFETAPFKLTGEMVEVLLAGPDGVRVAGGVAPRFEQFKQVCVDVFMCLRAQSYRLLLLLEVLAYHAPGLPCFADSPGVVIAALKDRFCLDLNDHAVQAHILRLIDSAADHWTTNCYDRYQKCCQGVL